MVVAIDGPAGSGKSTTARKVAQSVGYLYLDTGAMYRAVALSFMQEERAPTQREAEDLMSTVQVDMVYQEDELRVFLNEKDVTQQIRTAGVAGTASQVSGLRPVREKMVAEQRRIAREYEEKGGGVVVDGRDIGTVVFPEAEVKIFMIADAEERARRRKEELEAQGTSVTLDKVLAEMQQRDRLDQNRDLAPLRRAEDAIEFDTTRCTIEEQVQFVIEHIRERSKRQ